MADLEEIALHQLEIERIEAIGSLCRRLKILYLQNNIIGRIENLQHLKDLEYLNLALNNVKKIEGLESCEFLHKLDLTVNFIPLSNLEESARNLQHNKNLRELYILGNPCSDWGGHKDYLIGKVPWLDKIDGTMVSKSDRIRAAQREKALEKELQDLVRKELQEKATLSIEELEDEVDVNDDNAPYTPELRTAMYREMAEEKAEKEEREKERMPRERDYDKEHNEAVAEARSKQYFSDGRIRQCNEAGLEFSIEEDPSTFYFRVKLPRYVDTSLIDCQVFPRFVQVIFRDKTLRVALPGGGEEDEVRSEESKCERSKTTGELKVSMPKIRESQVLQQGGGHSSAGEVAGENASPNVRKLNQRFSRADQMLKEAVSVKTIYQGSENPNLGPCGAKGELDPVRSTNLKQRAIEEQVGVPSLDDDDDDE
eukprot:CAMPEP_0184539728 /NCGR_PEP_ID=MMETSP0198_2-20121128/18281_1 /TAXON_ID=1112570 /ORGANISM="Thraustochytrium sp., Strain LLF1b" /LENGTH=425 /DNA_ID=CAMNT_0026933263 /DNA_START=28 /DNA_END=1305 /DNA_ORIENTATION=+